MSLFVVVSGVCFARSIDSCVMECISLFVVVSGVYVARSIDSCVM